MSPAPITSSITGSNAAGVSPSISAASSTSRNEGASTAVVTSRCRARLSEVIEPPLRDLVNPLRQLSGNQHSAVIDDVHGVSSYCQDLWIKIV